MPALIQLLRVVIMALVSAMPLTAAQQFFDGTVRDIVKAFQDEHGLSQQEAKDIVSNILFDLGLNAALIGIAIKTKIGIKAAEFLGISSKGIIKKTLSVKASQVVANVSPKVAQAGAKSVALSVLKVAGGVGGVIWLASAVANIFEPGIYKPEQTNAVYRALGIPFQYPTTGAARQPGPYDANQFRDVASALESQGIKGFEYGFPIGTVLYSRDTLADLIDRIYGEQIMAGNTPSAKQLTGMLSKYLIGATTTAPQTSSTPAKTSFATQAVPQTRVFTGLVSQGTVGGEMNFTPRPDDLIENAGELQEAINNNVAPYLAGLLSRVTYEIKTVSSVIVKGLKKTGESRRVVSGQNRDGTQKFRTVVNKFAIAELYLITDRGTRSKITTIILGPTDALRFQPSSNDLINVAGQIPENIVVKSTDQISTVISNTPTATTTPQPRAPVQQAPTAEKFIGLQQGTGREYEGTGSTPATFISDKEAIGQAFGVELFDLQSSRMQRGSSGMIVSVRPKASAPVVVAPVLNQGALSARTLFEFYTALGRALPSVAERSDLYERLGLGQSAFYTGTSEQNAKLLETLKTRGV